VSPDLIAQTLDELSATDFHDVPVTDDPLSDALHYLRMDGMFYCRSELTAPWGIDLPPMPDCLWFHVVTHGQCILTDSHGSEFALHAGDIAVLPHGAGHRAVDEPGAETPVVFDLPHDYVSRQYAILRHGGGGQPTSIICGVVQLGHPAARRLLAMLPEIIHIEAAIQRDEWSWLPALLSLIAAETQSTRPGGETVVTRLCDVLVIQAIRSWIDTDPAALVGWLGALRDPTVGQAISLIHNDPSQEWTVTTLATKVGMSRSGFSARFSELVGTSPKHYVTEWRMCIAEDILRREDTSILNIATQLGYRSEAAFSRAFKRETGSAPSHVRRRRHPERATQPRLPHQMELSGDVAR
jgi:AraC-like DNA-binding protein